jgi:glucosamine--fructose-6-phosphate aminotransferase (isomerizing)
METPRWINGVEPSAHLLQANGTQILEIECREQAQRLPDLIRAYRSDPELRSQLKSFRRLSQKPGPVMFIGMGASYCSSFSASVLLTTHGRLSFSADAGEWLHYGRPVWNDAALSVLLTTSGESAELVELMKAGDDSTVGLICNNPASTCWNWRARSTVTRPKPTLTRPPLPSSLHLKFSSVRGRTMANV